MSDISSVLVVKDFSLSMNRTTKKINFSFASQMKIIIFLLVKILFRSLTAELNIKYAKSNSFHCIYRRVTRICIEFGFCVGVPFNNIRFVIVITVFVQASDPGAI